MRLAAAVRRAVPLIVGATLVLAPSPAAAQGGPAGRSQTYFGCTTFGDCYTVNLERIISYLPAPGEEPPSNANAGVLSNLLLAGATLSRPTMLQWWDTWPYPSGTESLTCCTP